MAKMLEQTEIDDMIALRERLDWGASAITKVRVMYLAVVGTAIVSSLRDMASIGAAVTEIGLVIDEDSRYWESFKMLERSYYRKLG